jgi:GT2 family glycosyltransferase
MDYCDGDTVVEKYQPSLSGDIFAEALSGQPIGSGSTLVVRPAVFNDIGGFDESLRRGIDGDFIRRVCRSYDVDFVPGALVKYHIGHEADRITSIDPESTEDAIQANEAKLRKFATEFEKYPSAKGAVYARLGLRHCLLGDYRTGVSYHLKAIRQAPLNPAVYKRQAVTIYRLLNMKP